MTNIDSENTPDISTKAMISSSLAGKQWDSIGIKHHHGIAVALFSIHSKTSCGIGEYSDLKLLIDWCREIGFDIIQLLPLNDTGFETSPYGALSAYALNPIHLGLSRLLDGLEDNILQEYALDLQSKALGSHHVDYPYVQKMKDLFLRRYYKLYGLSIKETYGYSIFLRENAIWLKSYSIFKALKIFQNWSSWESWPPEYKDMPSSSLEVLPSEIKQEAEYQTFIQYLCFTEFGEVEKYACEKGIFLKGDIPILINRESADVWMHRELFLLDLSAGAPPDMFTKDGQKWGFPPYNWNAMQDEGYQWWITRLNVAEKFYHLYRLDHIVGFFRLWSIPLSLKPIDGFFIPEDKHCWIPLGAAIMNVMLKNCDMLPIGEDLGVVPPEVRVYLKSIGISGTKVMRWERLWDHGGGFIDPKDYPAESMTTVSSHDTETLGEWWRNQQGEAALYAGTNHLAYHPELSREIRIRILKASHQSASLFHINLLSEYLSLIDGFVWPNLQDERINIPGTVSEKNWSYLTRPSLEEITCNSKLKQLMKEIIS